MLWTSLIVSLYRILQLFHRKAILHKPKEFKIAYLTDIKDLLKTLLKTLFDYKIRPCKVSLEYFTRRKRDGSGNSYGYWL